MRNIVDSRWFALADLFIVLACAAIRIIAPDGGAWIVLLALIPWVARLAAGQSPFRRTAFDLPVLVFLVTACIGYWAAYDKSTAWNKVWLVMLAVLLYYAVASQPKENWLWISLFVYGLGVSTSLYYFLTQDFVTAPRKIEFVNRIGLWLMGVRPHVPWTPIHPNYVAGLAAITTPFVLYPLRAWGRHTLFRIFTVVGLAIGFAALFMATSRGVAMAIVSAAGIWLVWQIAHLDGVRHRVRNEALFPSMVLLYVFLVVAFLYAGPASSGSIAPNYHFGDGSRAELLSRSFYLLGDYAITGGGLGSFPGLYSQYLLNIPFFNVPNSHNLFLDVAIEQGLFGGITFIVLYLASIWIVSRELLRRERRDAFLWNAIILFTLVVAFVHGMVDDYLYNGNGTILALLLVGLMVSGAQEPGKPLTFQLDRRIAIAGLLIIGAVFVFGANRILSTGYANLGAVRMSQVELNGFPNHGWVGMEGATQLTDAETALLSALQYDPANRTANQRLGMISIVRQDFAAASRFLEAAYAESPQHRGVIKSLAYCYLWLGDIEKAETFLSMIPEAREELDAYVSWWGTQGRDDLSEKAAAALNDLKSTTNQP